MAQENCIRNNYNMADQEKRVKNSKLKTSTGAMLNVKGVEKVVIHTMPKRFFVNEPKAQRAKGIGVLILVGGAIVIIGGLLAGYFFIIKKPEDNIQRKTVESYVPEKQDAIDDEQALKIEKEVNKQEKENEPITKPVGQDKEEQNPEIKDNLNGSTATSSEETATTTKKIIKKETATTTPKIEIKKGIDSDEDLLTDLEEIILDTNSASSDSDEDGFDDKAELLNLYNPAGGGKIIANSNIKKYSNSKYNYTLYHPDIWPLSNIGGDESIMFQLDNNQFIQIIVLPNAKKLSLDEWYNEQFEIQTIGSDQKMYKKGWNVIKSKDGLVVYLKHPSSDNIFTITYNLGINYTLNYENIFKMIVLSLEISK